VKRAAVLAMRVLIMVFLPRSLFGWLRKDQAQTSMESQKEIRESPK
jgi:hypothetical protein